MQQVAAPPRLRLCGVGHRFGTSPWLFRELSAEFVAGDLLAISGPSGSGKSTLLSLIADGQPAEGGIEFAGERTLQWVFQNPFGLPHRTTADHVMVPLLARGQERDDAADRVAELLELFGLDEVAEAPYSTLSGGQAQRLMLARAVAAEPALLLVDEPTSQLDPVNAANVIQVLSALSDERRIVAIATHDPRIAERASKVLQLGGTDA
ncbi:hypothetical protein BJH93_06480 [Kocuria polaris]|nr:hypothetical protein [Kocuria polaris]